MSGPKIARLAGCYRMQTDLKGVESKSQCDKITKKQCDKPQQADLS